jgi:putative transposase
LVERHVIKQADHRFAATDTAAFASKHLYNAANYIMRQSFLHDGVYLHYHEMHERIKDDEAYNALPAKVAQWILRLLDQNWQSAFDACAAWQEDPLRFLGHPKLLGYKDKQRWRILLGYTVAALSAPALRQGTSAPSTLSITITTRQTNVQQVRIIRCALVPESASMWWR